jgi:ATP-dependent RNA helicase RhlE
MSFENLRLINPIQLALANKGYIIPTPIQEKAIPVILEKKDLLGCAQTGTGKTAAFAIPILQILHSEKQSGKSIRMIKSLIVTPTRELAIQISESFSSYGKHTGLRNAVIYGGVSQKPQTDRLREGVDILIATPGRLLDLMNQNYINLKNIKLFVLDEADRMLDMGFINDVRKIIAKLPAQRQSLFFSATMPPEIVKLANTILSNPVKIIINPEQTTIESIKQSVYFVSKPDKKKLLIHLLKDKEVSSALVFTRTKRGADQVSKFLNGAKIQSEAIHSNKSQNARQRALNNFKSKKTRVLVATDIAARGIDVERLSHVINFEIPNISETYVHRIGRTGRAGLGGVALSFCDEEEREYLRDINGLIKTSIPVINDHPYPMSNSSRSSDGNENRFLYSKAGSIKKSGSSRFFNKKKKHWSRNSKPVGKS